MVFLTKPHISKLEYQLENERNAILKWKNESKHLCVFKIAPRRSFYQH